MSNRSLSYPSSDTGRVRQARRRARAEVLAGILQELSPSMGGRRRGWFTRRVGTGTRGARWHALRGSERGLCREIGWNR